MGRDAYEQGQFRFHDGGVPYASDNFAWGPDGGYGIIMFAERVTPEQEASGAFLGIDMQDPGPGAPAIARTLGPTTGAHLDGGFDGSATWDEIAPGVRMAAGLAGEPTCGPVLAFLDCAAGTEAVPARSISTETIVAPVSGSIDAGTTLTQGDVRVEESDVEQPALVAQPDREREPAELAGRARPAARAALQLLAYRLGERPLEAQPGAPLALRPRDHQRALGVRRAQRREHDHGFDRGGVAEVLREPLRAGGSEPAAVDRREHERLARDATLERAADLDQRGGVDRVPVARDRDHDLARRRSRAAGDDVLELLALGAEALERRCEPLVGEPLAHRPGVRPRAELARGGLHHARVEEDVGCEPLLHGRRTRLEREHGDDRRDHRRHEGRAVDAELDHPCGHPTAPTYNLC